MGNGTFHHGNSKRRNDLGELKNITLGLLYEHASGNVSSSIWVWSSGEQSRIILYVFQERQNLAHYGVLFVHVSKMHFKI